MSWRARRSPPARPRARSGPRSARVITHPLWRRSRSRTTKRTKESAQNPRKDWFCFADDWRRMSIVVQKYGGSSVADVSRIKQVADRVMRTRREGHEVVVVVSAMGDTTDDLLRLAKQVSPNPDRRELD